MKIVSAHLIRLRCWIEGLLQSTFKPPTGYLLFEQQNLVFQQPARGTSGGTQKEKPSQQEKDHLGS
jgi:hypothetical protein